MAENNDNRAALLFTALRPALLPAMAMERIERIKDDFKAAVEGLGKTLNGIVDAPGVVSRSSHETPCASMVEAPDLSTPLDMMRLCSLGRGDENKRLPGR